jgi:hypothetical protein
MTNNICRTTVTTIVGGAGRGAEAMLPAIQEWNNDSERFTIVPKYADPVPGRARQLTKRAKGMGISAEFSENRVQELITTNESANAFPIVLHVDRPGAIAEALLAAADRSLPVLGYLLMRLPDTTLVGAQLVFQEHENDQKLAAAAMFDELSQVTARSGTAEILGDRGRPEHLLAEPMYRARFGRHLQQNLRKLVAGLEPESAPIEFTFDGQDSVWTGIIDNRTGWADPIQLAGEVLERAPLIIVRGSDFALVELGPRGQGLRIHRVHYRIDGRVSMQGTLLVDTQSLAAAERELMQRHAAEALRRAVRATISRLEPIFTTD